MTDLNKDVSRRVNLPLDNRITMRSRDRITVTLHPGGWIGFRAHKCRHEYQIPLSACYKMAIQLELIEQNKIKQQDKKRRRLARRGKI